jgi:phosphomannomutase/phosphoglucomutase
VSVYKPCDIRGDAATQLTPALYRGWGRSLGHTLPPGTPFLVGGDVRQSTPGFVEALIEGLCEAGMAVADLGIVPTPMVYFAKRTEHAPACAIVTASHGPPPLNGLKWMIGDLPPGEQDVQALKRAVETHVRGGDRLAAGTRRTLDVSSEYRQWLAATWQDKAHLAHGHVILDPGNGCWSGRALEYLTGVFPAARLSAIHDEPDGRFPHRDPDVTGPQYLARLSQAVRHAQADLGIAFDGDGDRVAFVDDEGTPLTAEEATWVLLNSFGPALQDQTFVHDIKFSDRVAEAAKKLGACPTAERSGHAFIRTRMIRSRALFGAEISGHYFYRELAGGDDGLFTACRVILYLAMRGETLAGLRKACPAVFMTPDLRLAVPVERQQAVIKEVAAAFQEYPQSFTDGVRIDFPHGWALVRSSVTETALTFRFEGDSQESLRSMVKAFCQRMPSLGRELYPQYER